MNYLVQHYNADGQEWDNFVLSRPDATSYHLYAWKNVFERSFGHTAFYLAARDEGGKLCGVLPLVYMKSRLFGRFLVSVPFVNYGGLLCETGDAASALIAEATAVLKMVGARHVELRHWRAMHPQLPTKKHKVTMILDLADDTPSQWDLFNPKLRNQIRKAQKTLIAKVAHKEDLDSFYDVFVRNMRDLGTPVYSKCFFSNVLDTFPENTRVMTVRLDGCVVAAGILYWFRDTIQMPWASSVRDYKVHCPNNALYWEAIKFSIENGFKKFDFGRSTPGEGTFKFKEQWGAQPVQLYWQYLLHGEETIPDLNPHNPRYKTTISVWQKLPLAVTRVIGPLIVRNIP